MRRGYAPIKWAPVTIEAHKRLLARLMQTCNPQASAQLSFPFATQTGAKT